MITYVTKKSHHRTMADLSPRHLIKTFDWGLEVLKALGQIPTKVERDSLPCQMWVGYEHALVVYLHSAIAERVNRWRYRIDPDDPNAIDPQIRMGEVTRIVTPRLRPYVVPPWWEDLDVYRSHRSNLIRQDPEHYSGLWKGDGSPDWPYLWPVVDPEAEDGYRLVVSAQDSKRLDVAQRMWPAHLDQREIEFL